MVFDGAIKIVVKKTICIKMKKIAEKNWVSGDDLGFVFFIEI